MAIHIKDIRKEFKDFTALNGVSLDIESGELIALLGPSGSGKTTLLRIIAGLEVADSGHILIDREEADAKPMRERRVGFVFQHYALFRHMSVFDNIAFAMRVRPRGQRPDAATIRNRVMELLSLVHLKGMENRLPAKLSGGQRQRVALARALAVNPKVLLLDEPFGALDAKVRKELRRWMRHLHDELGVTTIFVTHDQEEAMEMADRVVVMSAGKIEQVGTPEEVYHNPANAFVYDFLGNYNAFDGWRDADGVCHILPPGEVPPGGMAHVQLFARPHNTAIYLPSAVPDDVGVEMVEAKIVHINPAGPLVKIEMEMRGGNLLSAEITREAFDESGFRKRDWVNVVPKDMRVFEKGDLHPPV